MRGPPAARRPSATSARSTPASSPATTPARPWSTGTATASPTCSWGPRTGSSTTWRTRGHAEIRSDHRSPRLAGPTLRRPCLGGPAVLLEHLVLAVAPRQEVGHQVEHLVAVERV